MAFGSASRTAAGLGLNKARIGEGNPIANCNLLSMLGLVWDTLPAVSAIDESPGKAVVVSLGKMI
jgi:hypothetical protein